MNLAAMHKAGAAMTPAAWCDIWVRAAGGEDVGLPLPAFPPEDVQKITNKDSITRSHISCVAPRQTTRVAGCQIPSTGHASDSYVFDMLE